MRLLLLIAIVSIGCSQPASTAELTADAASLSTTTLAVEGMTCGSCEVTIRVAVTKLVGVESVEVSYDRGSAVVHYDHARIAPEVIAQAITDLGYPTALEGH